MLKGKIHYIGFCLALVCASGLEAKASELSRGSRTAGENSRSQNGGAFSQLPVKSNNILVMGTEKISSGLPALEKTLHVACRDGGNLCRDKDKLKKTYNAASRALGIPASALVCLTKIESNMQSGRTSHAGAKGVTQFMPATAKGYARLMLSQSKYRTAWENFKDLGGTQRSPAAFSRANILSSSPQNLDVQIFAAALYWRKSIDDSLNGIKRYLGLPPDMTKLYRFLIVGYNSTPRNAQKYLAGSGLAHKGLKKETRNYFKKFDRCIQDAGGTPQEANQFIAALESFFEYSFNFGCKEGSAKCS